MGRSYAALTGSLEKLTGLGADEMDKIVAKQALNGIKLGSSDHWFVIHEFRAKWFRERVGGPSRRFDGRRVCHPKSMMAEAQLVVGVTTVSLKAVSPMVQFLKPFQ